MKTFLSVLVLLALTAEMPAFATEAPPLPVSSPSVASPPDASASTVVGVVLPQNSEPLPWLAPEQSYDFTANSCSGVSWCVIHCGGPCIIFAGVCQCP
jgi:hypothetical protein